MYVCVCAKPANVSIHQTVTAVGAAPEGRMRESQTKTGRQEHSGERGKGEEGGREGVKSLQWAAINRS